MKTPVLLLCCLLTVPAVQAQQAASGDEDPFEFLKDERNTEYSRTPNTAASQAGEATQTPVPADNSEDPFEFLLDDSNTVFSLAPTTSGIAPGKGEIRLGLQYVSDDNFTLGRYNGLNRQGWLPVLDINYGSWQQHTENGSQPLFWKARLQDGGTDVQEGEVTVGRRNHFRLSASFDQQLQANNDSGRSPFDAKGNLPANWVPSNITSGMTLLDDSLSSFKQKIERDKYAVNYQQQINKQWSMESNISTEKKDGKQTLGGAFYLNGANPHAAVLPQKINQTTNEFDLAFHYGDEKLHLGLSYLYSDFDNHKNGLQWQNPYDANFGANVDYPNGYGQMSLPPDTEMQQLRLLASYQFTPKLRAYGDASYSRASQDENYLPYTVNPSLVVNTAEPRTNLNGDANTTVANGGILFRPFAKLSLDLNYHYYDRDNDSPRDGYLYPPADSGDQPGSEFTVYNRPYEVTKNRVELKGSYRLPKQTRFSLAYQYENISRHNAATRETDENSLEAALRFRPFNKASGRFSLAYSDRKASTYNWDQSYYAFLDSQLINQTPDNQRYSNHPLLSQYYLSSRERWQAKFNGNYLASERWNLNLDMLWDDKDYDKTTLGLKSEQQFNTTLSANYNPGQQWSLSSYYSFDYYEAKQFGRSFRGGAEKNAFVTAPPYPQASDPERDWSTKPETSSHAIGINVEWTPRPDELDMTLDYSFVDTRVKQHFTTFGADDLSGQSLPDNKTHLHHLKWDANYHFTDILSVSLNYQFYYYEEDDWALDGVAADTVDKVLLTGEKAPDDTLHVIGLSVLYQLP